MGEKKECITCHETKIKEVDFYFFGGSWRGQCKACTIKKNVLHQRKVQAWKRSYPDSEARNAYMRSYYNKNKDKFAKYRKDFNEKHPDYQKLYQRQSRAKKKGEEL